MEQMMEDRRKRDKELASERETWEREADRRAREMEKQMDALMKLVGDVGLRKSWRWRDLELVNSPSFAATRDANK